MSALDLNRLSDSELSKLPTDEFVSALRELPRDAVEDLRSRDSLTDAQSGAVSAFLSMAPLHPQSEDALAGLESKYRAAFEDKYVPLKNRLIAWWHGTTERDLMAPPTGAAFGIESDDKDENESGDGWLASSVDIAEKLWGEGFIEPGSTQFARKVLAPAIPDSTKTVLDLTTGLGGTAFMLARENNVWMEAFEPDLTLAEKAREIAQSYMLSKRVPIKHADFATLSLPSKRYDLIYSRERLYTSSHKHRLLQQAAGALKPGGQLLITDYVRNDQSGFTQAFNSWVDAEPNVVFPWTTSQYTDEVRKAGLKLRSSHDFSDRVVEQIHTGWHRMVRSLDSNEVSRKYVDNLLREGEIWLARAKALQSGDVQVTRFIAVT